MAIDYQAIYTALYDRAATHADGAALRALLGGSSSVFPAKDLGNLSGKTLPYLVWRPLPIGGQSWGMRDVSASWWAYAAPALGTYALHGIAREVDNLYGIAAPFAIDGGRLAVTFIGAPFLDGALGLQGLEIRIGYTRLG